MKRCYEKNVQLTNNSVEVSCFGRTTLSVYPFESYALNDDSYTILRTRFLHVDLCARKMK